MASLIGSVMASTAGREAEEWNIGSHWDQGAFMQRDRVERVATLCAQKHPGDLIEIGAYVGLTTIRLAYVAWVHGRRVIAVDPWEPGTQNCAGHEYEEFLQNTARLKSHVDVLRFSSLDAAVREEVRRRPLCFAFVDGLHAYEACAHDIETVNHAAVIAVDDIIRLEGVRRAFQEAAEHNQWHAVTHPRCREGYLVQV